jgi:hypothetical protein
MNIANRQSCACNQPPFSADRTQLTGKPSAPFERELNFGIEATFVFYIHVLCVHDFYL